MLFSVFWLVAVTGTWLAWRKKVGTDVFDRVDAEVVLYILVFWWLLCVLWIGEWLGSVRK